MKRAAIEKSRTKNIWRKHWSEHVRQHISSGGQKPIACACDLQQGRFRKGQKQSGCGKPRCYICHGEKLLGIPKHRDRKLSVIADEQERSAEGGGR